MSDTSAKQLPPDADPHFSVQPPTTDAVPEIYCNTASFTVGLYDALIRLGVEVVGDDGKSQSHPVIHIRMSHPHAWVFAKLLNRILDEAIADIGPFSIPDDVLQRLHLEDEYAAMRSLK